MTNIRLFHPTKLRHWRQIYRLYRRAFPRSERKPFSIIRRMYREGRSVVWYALTDTGRFAGMATTIEGDSITLLDYFAIPKKLRGQGVGTVFLKQLLALNADRGLFVEIEATDWEDPTGEKRRRKQFYLRCGLEEMHVTAFLFGVRMELLGRKCRLDFDGYRAFYHDHYSPWAAEHILPAEN